MNKFIRDFLYTLLCNSFLRMQILPKFDTSQTNTKYRLRLGIGKKYPKNLDLKETDLYLIRRPEYPNLTFQYIFVHFIKVTFVHLVKLKI